MNQNPYRAPAVDDELRVTSSVDPELARQIGARIRRLNSSSLIFAVIGLTLQGAAQLVRGFNGALCALGGTALFIYALSLYARMRNRNAWWGLLGLASCLGFLALLVLPKHCHHCGATTKARTCARCGAPAPF